MVSSFSEFDRYDSGKSSGWSHFTIGLSKRRSVGNRSIALIYERWKHIGRNDGLQFRFWWCKIFLMVQHVIRILIEELCIGFACSVSMLIGLWLQLDRKNRAMEERRPRNIEPRFHRHDEVILERLNQSSLLKQNFFSCRLPARNCFYTTILLFNSIGNKLLTVIGRFSPINSHWTSWARSIDWTTPAADCATAPRERRSSTMG